jgi:hypothetical protein
VLSDSDNGTARNAFVLSARPRQRLLAVVASVIATKAIEVRGGQSLRFNDDPQLAAVPRHVGIEPVRHLIKMSDSLTSRGPLGASERAPGRAGAKR